MMDIQYKLLLLDDEEIVLTNIQKVFRFEDYGFTLAGVHSRPLRALSCLEEEKPDLIITDIRMPLMSGLEFAKEARSILPDVEIVILSGYDDFSYAQTAVKIGVRDYLLKPVKKDDFAGMLGEMYQRIQKKRSEQASVNALREQAKLSVNELKTNFFLQLAENDHINRNRMQQTYRMLDLDLEDDCFILIKFNFNSILFAEDTMSEVGKLSVDAESLLSVFGGIEPFLSDESVYIFLHHPHEISYEDVEESMLSYCRNKRTEGLVFTVGISRIHRGLAELFDANQECNQRIWIEESRAEEAAQNLHEILDRNLTIPYDLMEDLFRTVTAGDREAIAKSVGRIYQFPQSMESQLMLQYSYSISFLILLRLFQLQQKYDLTERIIPPQLLELRNLRYQYPAIREQSEMIIEFSEAIAELISTQELAAPTQMVRAAADYIHGHYSENISLSATADAIGISKNYLCEIFKKEMGTTFINYVTNYRIERAKELLARPELKMYEISTAVGFQDYTYFSQIFKKRTGMTLSTFRKMHG